MKQIMKLRWSNGCGFEDGTCIPYSYWLENRKTGDITMLDANKFEKFLRENNLTLKDFRNHNERDLTARLCRSLHLNWMLGGE